MKRRLFSRLLKKVRSLPLVHTRGSVTASESARAFLNRDCKGAAGSVCQQRVRSRAGRSFAIALVPVAAIILAEQSSAIASDNVDVELRIKAAFIYNFARFVEWPAHSGMGPVRIGVLGAGELTSPLAEAVRGKTANGRSIEVARINAATAADCCEILFIERSESKFVREVVESLAGKPVLTVCDGANGFHEGVMIAFQLVDDSVRFQINQDAAERAGLKISSQLLKVAIPASGKHP